jgi:SAM-dependent methyltransferase/DNA-binding MarR family transcriptional regulator
MRFVSRPAPDGDDPGQAGSQYLEDLACAYWCSEALFTAVEAGLFTLLAAGGRTAGEIAGAAGFDPGGTERWLRALCALGLLKRAPNPEDAGAGLFVNSELSARFLAAGCEDYQGDALLWRRFLAVGWQGLRECLQAGVRVLYPPVEEPHERLVSRMRRYILAMDGVARAKAREIIPVFGDLFTEGAILDAGGGSGAVAAAFLERFPGLRAVLLDLPEVVEYAEELLRSRSCAGRVACRAANILEPWPVSDHSFELVIISNVLHAYSEQEAPQLLARGAACLSPGGLLLVHDFFTEHCPAKAALFDLNMLINTYNGRVFPAAWVQEQLSALGLVSTGLVPLRTDTALIVAGRDERALARLGI